MEYKQREVEDMEPYYTRHAMAMTKEGLDSKSAIAAELAYRDMQIEQLQQQNKEILDMLITTTAVARLKYGNTDDLVSPLLDEADALIAKIERGSKAEGK